MSELKDLPNGWIKTKFSEITNKIVDGSHNPPPKTDIGLPMLSARNIEGGLIRFEEDYRLISEQDFEREDRRTKIKFGDILLTIVGAIGRCAVVPKNIQPFTLQRSVAVLSPIEVDSQFLSYQLQSPNLQKDLLDRAKGTAQKGVYLKSLNELTIDIPPLNEQRRIVSTIEQLTDRSHKARTALEDVPKLIAQFRQSVLAAAFRGDLTADWREKNPDIEPANLIVEQIETKNTKGKHKNKLEEVEILNESQLSTLPDSWCWGTPSIACSDIVDCPHATAEYIEKGKILIRTSDFRFGYLDISNVKFVSDEIFDKRTKRLQPSALDILYSREGGIFGIACLVPSDLELCMGQRMMLLRANRQCYEPELLMWAMNSPQIFRQASKKVTGTASPHVNVCDIKEFSLPIPPLEEQREILSKINRAFRILHCISEEYLDSSKEIEQLDRSILAKAFRGELVPQDPNDEPTAVLLERIHAEREQTSTLKQRGKTTSKDSSKQLSIAYGRPEVNDLE